MAFFAVEAEFAPMHLRLLVARYARLSQPFEGFLDVAGLAIESGVLVAQWKAGCIVVKFAGVAAGRGERRGLPGVRRVALSAIDAEFILVNRGLGMARHARLRSALVKLVGVALAAIDFLMHAGKF